jgi:ABC-type nitrate/sulfonate/bicarbonate transport system substrate-binding protein
MVPELPTAAETFLTEWGRAWDWVASEAEARADLAALLAGVRATERERAAAHIDVDFNRPGREFAAAIRGMK